MILVLKKYCRISYLGFIQFCNILIVVHYPFGERRGLDGGAVGGVVFKNELEGELPDFR